MKRTVIVTGGAQGIGLGIATCFARQGADLVIADRNPKQGKVAVRQLSRLGVGAEFVECDITDRRSVEAMARQAVAAFGHIDVLVNNAGICPFVDIMKMEPKTWQRTLDVNLTGAFHCTQVVAGQMIRQQKGGRIVFITSLAENIAGRMQVDYAASKSGLRMMMVGFAEALGPHGITANAVAPGMILTDMTRFHWEKPGPARYIKKRVPVGRIGRPEDIGNACVFLASEQAAYISGITVRVDGGYMCTSP
jgi:NAD(P)-dependent dehydrogenase (short-subunit alcohol dehydrogenase family)